MSYQEEKISIFQRQLKENEIELESIQVKELISAKETLKADFIDLNKKRTALEKQVIAPLKEESRILKRRNKRLRRRFRR